MLSLRLKWQRHTDLNCYTAFFLMLASQWRETKPGGSIAARCKDTTERTRCGLIYTDFNIFIYSWIIDIFICWRIWDDAIFFKLTFELFPSRLVTGCVTAEHVCCGVFCLFKNKHLNRFLQEAKTIFFFMWGKDRWSKLCVWWERRVGVGRGWALVFAVEAFEFRQLKRGKHGMRVWLLCERQPNELVSTTGNKPRPVLCLNTFIFDTWCVIMYLPTYRPKKKKKIRRVPKFFIPLCDWSTHKILRFLMCKDDIENFTKHITLKYS